MLTKETKFKVKNRSAGVVVYRIPETNVRREFAPGETKVITFEELEQLTYQRGGRELLEEFLQIVEEEVTNNLGMRREPEYNMSEEAVKNLLTRGSLDAFLDALDFAPLGVIDLIKAMSVSLPLTDYNKRIALKKKTGFDVDAALAHVREEMEEAKSLEDNKIPAGGRRVKPAEEPAPAPDATSKRRTIPEYKIVSMDK